MYKKMQILIGGLILITLLVTGCSVKQKICNQISSIRNHFSQEDADPCPISGTYVGDSPRKWQLNIYDDGTLQLDDNRGTYEKVGDTYLFTIDGYAFKLKAEITDNGNLYITSDNSNWEAEIYEKYAPKDTKDNKVELADALGNNWETFCRQTKIDEYEQFEITENYDDGTYDSIGNLGTELEVLGDGNLFCIGIGGYESKYTLCGAYIGQSFNESEKCIEQYGLDRIEGPISLEEGEKYDSYSLWRSPKIELYIHERAGDTAMIFASWNH